MVVKSGDLLFWIIGYYVVGFMYECCGEYVELICYVDEGFVLFDLECERCIVV